MIGIVVIPAPWGPIHLAAERGRRRGSRGAHHARGVRRRVRRRTGETAIPDRSRRGAQRGGATPPRGRGRGRPGAPRRGAPGPWPAWPSTSRDPRRGTASSSTASAGSAGARSPATVGWPDRSVGRVPPGRPAARWAGTRSGSSSRAIGSSPVTARSVATAGAGAASGSASWRSSDPCSPSRGSRSRSSSPRREDVAAAACTRIGGRPAVTRATSWSRSNRLRPETRGGYRADHRPHGRHRTGRRHDRTGREAQAADRRVGDRPTRRPTTTRWATRA